MTQDEVVKFLAEESTAVLCTLFPDDRIHAVPMWFSSEGVTVFFSAKSKSQKVVNLRRRPQSTVLVEAGRHYAELRGVQMSGQIDIIDEPETVARYVATIAERYSGVANAGISVDRKALNRSLLRFTPDSVASWDHRKLV
jgi:PPOX class probable F420-dependent enzyme